MILPKLFFENIKYSIGGCLDAKNLIWFSFLKPNDNIPSEFTGNFSLAELLVTCGLSGSSLHSRSGHILFQVPCAQLM